MSRMITWELVKDNTTLASQGSIYTEWLNLTDAVAFGFKIIVDSGTTPKVNLSYQIIESNQCDVDLVGEAAPGDLKEANKSATSPTTGNELVAEITSGNQADGFSPMCTKWLRFKMTGNTGNDTDTKVSLWFSKQVVI